MEGRSQTVAAAVQEIGRYLIGQDPRRIEHHWQAIYRGQFYRGGPVLCSALSGIEQALWDITGKWLGQPVYQLLGGATRERIRMYGWVHGDSYGEYIEHAKVRVDEGFTAIKMGVSGDWSRWIRWRGSNLKSSASLPCAAQLEKPSISAWISTGGSVRPWRCAWRRPWSHSAPCSSKSRSCPKTWMPW